MKLSLLKKAADGITMAEKYLFFFLNFDVCFYTRKRREDILVRFSLQYTKGQHEVPHGEGCEDANEVENSNAHQDEGED